MSVATAGSFYIMDTQFEDKVNGLLLPTLFVFLLSYFTWLYLDRIDEIQLKQAAKADTEESGPAGA